MGIMNISQMMPLSKVTMDAQAFAYLTPEALMTYCSSRLQGIDTQVQEAFAKQQSANQDSAVLGNLANAIQLPTGDLDLTKGADFKTALHAAQQMEGAANSCRDPATKKALLDAAQKVYGKLQAVLNDRLGNQKTFETIDGSTTDDAVDNIVNNTDSKHGGSVSDADKAYSLNQFKSDTSDTVHTIQQSLNTSAELSMINLQSLMSQRQESIQLCTNLVQALGDQCNKIADNVGK
jgi:hypothetical protein